MDTAQQLFDANQDLARIVAIGILRGLSLRADAGAVSNYALAGLWDAAKRYDPARRKPFRTYASYRIRFAVMDGLREESEGARSRPGILQTARSLSDRLPSGDEAVSLVCRCSHRATEIVEAVDRLAVARRVLSWRHRVLLRLVFDEGWTLKAAATVFGVCPSRLTQVMADAIQQMGEQLIREERCRA